MKAIRFLQADTGAVTVDRVVLTAALVGLGLATMAVVSTGVQDTSQDIEAQLSATPIHTRFPPSFETASFEDVTGGTPTAWGFIVAEVDGWTRDSGHTFELVVASDEGRSERDGTHVLDMGNAPGNLAISKTRDAMISRGEYTFSIAAALNGDDNAVDVYFGGELVGTVDPTTTDFEQFEFALEGGSGDGSNRLQLVGTGPSDNFGTYVDDIQMTSVR